MYFLVTLYLFAQNVPPKTFYAVSLPCLLFWSFAKVLDFTSLKNSTPGQFWDQVSFVCVSVCVCVCVCVCMASLLF